MKYKKQNFITLTTEKKMEIIKAELNQETHNATTKEDLLMLLDWLYYEKVVRQQ